MFKNSVWTILVVLSLILGTANFESASARPNQEEAPQVPNLLSPGNGSTASSNPPTLCAQSSDPDGNLQGIKFEVNGGGEGDHISPFIQVDGNGVACWQDNSTWSEQDHAWQARAVDSVGNQSGASGQWNIKIPVTESPAQSETCTVNDLYADRSAPQTVGITINFTVVATCTNGVNKIETFVDGRGVGTIHGGSGSISWNTNGYGAGNHVFSVQAFGNNGGSAGRSHSYDLVNQTGGQEQNNSNPNNSFGNCEAIKIGYEVFVIVKEGSAIQRRHVPNPETLDALGFSQQAINNKGFSDSELKTIGQGSDIPDVVVEPNGFNTFKSTFCPNKNAIVPNQSTEQLPVGQFDPHANGVCPGWETRLWIGAYARVTNQGDQLKLRSGPTLNDSVITKMSAGQKFTVIGGPQCNDSYTWWNIQGDMGTGWAAEAGDKWWMAPMTEPPVVSNETPVVPNDNNPAIATVPDSTSDASPFVDTDCAKLATGQWWNPFNPPDVGAMEQCTDYVRRTNQAVIDCWGEKYPMAGLWDNWAIDQTISGKCNWSVTPADSSGLAISQPGDIVVWNGSKENGGKICSGANTVGHVAIFRGANSDGTIRMSDSNSEYNQEKTKLDPTCMSIIHINNSDNATSDNLSDTLPSNPPTIVDKCSQLKGWKWILCKIFGV